MPSTSQVERLLKEDALGRVELVRTQGGRFVRRVACGGRVPGSRLVARVLLARERRALTALAGLEGVAGIATGEVQPGEILRTWVEGEPLSEAQVLPRDFFELLAELVGELHARGVCHNDLHKEQNVLVRADGRPVLLDFQLASVHGTRGAVFASRCREDLRHVAKHRRRYELRGAKGPRGERRARRGAIAWTWLRLGKPLYHVVAGALSARDGEPRRPSSGPWPEWGEPVRRP